MKCIPVGGALVVHAASSLPGSDLLTVTLDASQSSTQPDGSAGAQAKEWQDKAAASIARKLLARCDASPMKGAHKSLSVSSNAAGARDRPAANVDVRPRRPSREDGCDIPSRSPFSPGHPDLDPLRLWTPHSGGSLLGPRHLAWGGGLPGRFGGGAGMMPRFDPVGPGHGDPDPDHMPVFPGFHPDFQPGFQGGASGRGGGRFDPDGMFIM